MGPLSGGSALRLQTSSPEAAEEYAASGDDLIAGGDLRENLNRDSQ
jgi:hypothetical protein